MSVIYIKEILKRLLTILTKALVKVRLLDDFVLVHVDGGICSQMHFYMIGQHFKAKGYRVKYDISWFQNDGFDLLKQNRRDFMLNSAFPKLNFEIVNKVELFFYSYLNRENNYYDDATAFDWLHLKSPIFLTGYYRTPKELYLQYSNQFVIDSEILDNRNREMLSDIRSRKETVAIHVRRGDLAVFNTAYGEPVPISYFKNSINYISEKVESPHFYIFSDDYKWIEEVLLLEIGENISYTKIDFNDVGKGYCDLFLMASCKHKITSKGSFGKYASFLNNREDSIITLYDDSYERRQWEGKYPGFVFIK